MDHGDEPANFPSIEVEKKLSAVEGLTNFLINNPSASTRHEVLRQILETTNEARGNFHEFLKITRDERLRLIELSCASSE